MSLHVLEAVLWVFGIRGHIPGNDGLPERPAKSVAGNSAGLRRALAMVAAVLTALVLIVWTAVWLVIKSL